MNDYKYSEKGCPQNTMPKLTGKAFMYNPASGLYENFNLLLKHCRLAFPA